MAMPERKKSRLWLWLLLTPLLLFGMLVLGLGALGSMASRGASSAGMQSMIHETRVARGSGGDVVHIDLEGVITAMGGGSSPSMTDWLEAQIAKAAADPNVVAIVVRVSSPGGEVTASDRIHNAIQKADRVKPVVAYLDTIAASGGYYAACGSRHIIAHPTSLTGSIGVIMQSINYQGLLDKVGLRFETFKSGAFKDMLSGSREATAEEKAYVQELVAETYDRFLTVVSEGREIPLDILRASTRADGRIFSGRDALEGGMADSNGFLEDAYAKARELADAPDAGVTRYRVRRSLLGALSMLSEAEASPPAIEVRLTPDLLPALQPGVPYFLYLP